MTQLKSLHDQVWMSKSLSPSDLNSSIYWPSFGVPPTQFRNPSDPIPQSHEFKCLGPVSWTYWPRARITLTQFWSLIDPVQESQWPNSTIIFQFLCNTGNICKSNGTLFDLFLLFPSFNHVTIDNSCWEPNSLAWFLVSLEIKIQGIGFSTWIIYYIKTAMHTRAHTQSQCSDNNNHSGLCESFLCPFHCAGIGKQTQLLNVWCFYRNALIAYPRQCSLV